MVLHKGLKNDNVRILQEFVGCEPDGIFGPITEQHVKNFQESHGLWPDGVVGPKTWALLKIATTDQSETNVANDYVDGSWKNLKIEKHMLPKGEYISTPTKKEWVFLHHTAGWNNPFRTIDNWAGDSRGRIATEYVIGGQSIDGDDNNHDGVVVQCIPGNGYAWHLGKNGSHEMHIGSVGIEICSFGYLKDGKTYTGRKAHESQIVTLEKPFHNRTQWHRYSDAQIKSTRDLLYHIANEHDIDIREGLPALIKQKGAAAFDWNESAYYGRIKGVLSHSMTNKGKSDIAPQPEMMQMLVEL